MNAEFNSTRQSQRVSVVVVTYNRADLLRQMLTGLAAQTRPIDEVLVIDNASTDHTGEVLREVARTHPNLALRPVRMTENLGGAGGFHEGVRLAHEAGADRVWLMDDDVIPATDCLTVLLAHGGPCLMAVREDTSGALMEKAAIRFDLTNPLAIRPKRASVDSTYAARSDMPAEVPLENVAFEGFMVTREVIDRIGLPDPRFFIFYDDVDYAIRARRAGFPIMAVRDAVLVRQLDFNQQHDLSGWKGFYMYRNLFVVHLRYGENLLVRLKPVAITVAAVLLSPLRGGWREARNVIRAMISAWSLRRLSEEAAPRS